MSLLEKSIEELKKQVSELKDKPPTTIERLEYKFDQLKVETLEGTLNIGLNPTDPSNQIEQFDVQQGQNQMQPQDPFGEMREKINKAVTKNVYDYLQKDGINTVKKIEKRNQCQLDDTNRHLVIEDIRKQISSRINYYLQHLRLHDQANMDEQIEEMSKRVKYDIENSINQFIQHLPNEMKGEK
ncbi:spore germination protein GerPC [Bacillus carboniphilus]|uniref:Spore germination protein GerPC n=1 Tax=Bacillus carboniphilus TaxID=86663 RepID=A0ABY9JXW6_9BACI|nr:spore germination protein GerPC [Bacillus carboniphilus]WLR44224.1 spore germination protein GerPC [Bacillus carboniphilus]